MYSLNSSFGSVSERGPGAQRAGIVEVRVNGGAEVAGKERLAYSSGRALTARHRFSFVAVQSLWNSSRARSLSFVARMTPS